MHCPNFNMLSNPLLAQSSSPHISIEINSGNNGSGNLFNTLDCIKGKVVVSVPRKTDLEKIDITFEGSTTSSVSRAIPFAPGRREAYHPFLSVQQPTNINDHTTQKALLPGKTYNFPFEFVIPGELLPQCCDHEVQHGNVRKAHTRLPPSFGRDPTKIWQYTDGMTPKTCQISYLVRAMIFEKPRNEATASPVVYDASRAVLVVPRVKTKTQLEDGPVRRVFKELHGQPGWMRRKGGQIQLAAEQPRPIRLLSCGTASIKSPEPTIELHFHFDPKERESSLPRFHHVKSRLEAATYHCTVPGDDIPTSNNPGSPESDREAYFATVPLSSHDLSSVNWEQIPSFSSGLKKNAEFSEYASESESTLVESSSENGYIASTTVPIILPSDRNLVPTFHSCLVSRSYVLELTLSYSMPHSLGSSTASLRVPLELI